MKGSNYSAVKILMEVQRSIGIKKWGLSIVFLSMMTVIVTAQTSISGKVTYPDFQEEVIGASVIFYQAGFYKAGISTDFDGNYQLEIEAGVYDVEVSYVGYPTTKIKGVLIKEELPNVLDINLENNMKVIGCPVVSYYFPIRLSDRTNTTSGLTLDAYEIESSSGKNIKDIISNAPGVSFGH